VRRLRTILRRRLRRQRARGLSCLPAASVAGNWARLYLSVGKHADGQAATTIGRWPRGPRSHHGCILLAGANRASWVRQPVTRPHLERARPHRWTSLWRVPGSPRGRQVSTTCCSRAEASRGMERSRRTRPTVSVHERIPSRTAGKPPLTSHDHPPSGAPPASRADLSLPLGQCNRVSPVAASPRKPDTLGSKLLVKTRAPRRCGPASFMSRGKQRRSVDRHEEDGPLSFPRSFGEECPTSRFRASASEAQSRRLDLEHGPPFPSLRTAKGRVGRAAARPRRGRSPGRPHSPTSARAVCSFRDFQFLTRAGTYCWRRIRRQTPAGPPQTEVDLVLVRTAADGKRQARELPLLVG
jgi:hypothetical protein